MPGISTTTSALTILRDRRAGSRHQDALIIVTVGGGVLGQGGLDGVAILLMVLPWCVLVALVAGPWVITTDRRPKARVVGSRQ